MRNNGKGGDEGDRREERRDREESIRGTLKSGEEGREVRGPRWKTVVMGKLRDWMRRVERGRKERNEEDGKESV